MEACVALAACVHLLYTANALVHTGFGTPVASLVLHVVVVLALNLISFEALVEADMLLTV